MTGQTAPYAMALQKQRVINTSPTVLTNRDADGVVFVDSSGAPITITLPPRSSVLPGRHFKIVALNGATNPVTVQPTAGDTYNGGLSAPIVIVSSGGEVEAIARATGQWGVTSIFPVTQAQVTGTLLMPAADAALALLNTTRGAQLVVTGAATVVISTTSSYAGQVINLFALAVAGGGSYTLALDVGTLTFNAASEGATIMRNAANTAWVCVGLSGATIV